MTIYERIYILQMPQNTHIIRVFAYNLIKSQLRTIPRHGPESQ